MDAFVVLSEPVRRRILDLVKEDERSVTELIDELGMSQPAVSKHLRVLRESGMVTSRVDGQRRLYRLRPDPLEEVESWLAPYRQFWRERLDALERHLESVKEEEGARAYEEAIEEQEARSERDADQPSR
jgi:DNA-binding transcriptional ArsR family regulator